MVKGKDIRNNGIVIKLDKERKINFDLNAFCELEEIFGDINKAFEGLGKGSMKAVRALLYAGLKTDDDTLTLSEVGQLITMQNIGEVSAIISNSLSSAMPEIESNDIGEIEKEKN